MTIATTEDCLEKGEAARVSEICKKTLKVFQKGMNLAIFLPHNYMPHGSRPDSPSSSEETQYIPEKN
jgi:hypothetical protein